MVIPSMILASLLSISPDMTAQYKPTPLSVQGYRVLQQRLIDPNPADNLPVAITPGEVSSLLGANPVCSDRSSGQYVCEWSDGSRRVELYWYHGQFQRYSGSGF